MTDVGEMRVVVVERVRCDAVGERRGARWNHFVQSRDGSRFLAAFVGDEAADDFGDGLVLARPRQPTRQRANRKPTGVAPAWNCPRGALNGKIVRTWAWAR